MKGVKPANGPDGLKAYDPDSYALLDDIYSGVQHNVELLLLTERLLRE